MDTPLSMVASIAGMLTFFVAVIPAILEVSSLRSADVEFERAKTALSW